MAARRCACRRAGIARRRNADRVRRTDDDLALSRAGGHGRSSRTAWRQDRARGTRPRRAVRLPARADVDRTRRRRPRDSRARACVRARILRRRTRGRVAARPGRVAPAASRCGAGHGAARNHPDGQRTRRMGRAGRDRPRCAGAPERARFRFRRRRRTVRQHATGRCCCRRRETRRRCAVVRMGRRSRRRPHDGRRRGAARRGRAGRRRAGRRIDGRLAGVADRGGDFARDGCAPVRAARA
ncbi:hypothetical protein BME24068_06640 [Burkholderia metallica]|nr:hypothetical protein BME24068_06640 [Burkholderia metallica]